MTEDLQCSWDVLNTAEDLVGENPTNQKIYFGKDLYGNPLQFWVARREDADENINANGNVMCLYQAKTVDLVS